MKKRLNFLYRYLSSLRHSSKWRRHFNEWRRHFNEWRLRWITPQSIMVLGISVTFLGTLAWTAPYTDHEAKNAASRPDFSERAVMMNSGAALQSLFQQPEATPDPNLPPTRTPLPAEYLSNSNQTIGITVASIVLVLIVVVGVLMLLPRRDEN